jgi:hypothetical protein
MLVTYSLKAAAPLKWLIACKQVGREQLGSDE